MTSDQINAIFEGFAALFILNHCRILYRDKSVKGVSLASTVFFFAWGIWNIRYYPSLGQIDSFRAGCLVAIANAIWIALMIYYKHGHFPLSEHREEDEESSYLDEHYNY